MVRPGNKNITESIANLNLDRDLNNLISKKPKRVDRYSGELNSIIMPPQKKKIIYKDIYKNKKSFQDSPGKPYSMNNNTSLIKKPLRIQINHMQNPLDIGMDQNLHNDGSTGGIHGY